MIDYFDFVKLYVIFNAKIPNVIDNAVKVGHELSERGYFDRECQVMPNDFLEGFELIRREIEKLRKEI